MEEIKTMLREQATELRELRKQQSEIVQALGGVQAALIPLTALPERTAVLERSELQLRAQVDEHAKRIVAMDERVDKNHTRLDVAQAVDEERAKQPTPSVPPAEGSDRNRDVALAGGGGILGVGLAEFLHRVWVLFFGSGGPPPAGH